MRNKPKVSVIMPAYNGEKYIKKAIDSILNQTFTDFELLIILNESSNSNDRSFEIINSYTDSRIKLVKNEKLGLSIARNLGIKLSRGEYIANLDCDDISLKDRLQKQVDFLSSHPDFGLIGSYVENIDKNGNKIGNIWSFPALNEEIPTILFFGNYFAQSSTMIRKSALSELQYNLDIKVAEDYDLWIRIAEKDKVWNLQEVLTQIRSHGENSTIILGEFHPSTVKKIYNERLSKLNFKYSDEDLDKHYLFCVGKLDKTKDNTIFLAKWFRKINKANSNSLIFNRIIFTKALIGRWYLFCKKDDKYWWFPTKIFWKSSLIYLSDLNFKDKIIFIVKLFIISYEKILNRLKTK